MRVLIIGDSVPAGMGLGQRGSRFGLVAARELGAEAVLDLARPSRTTNDAVAMMDEIAAFRPTVAFVCCGGTEALVHPGAGIQRIVERLAPESWHGVAGLHPRPRYSSVRGRRLRQRASSWTKVALKHVLIRVTRASARVPSEAFGASLSELLRGLDALECSSYVLAMCHIDEWLFPKCEGSLAAVNVEIERAVSQTRFSHMVSVREEMHYWDDFLADRAHWSLSGHQRVAARLVEAVRADPTAPAAPVADGSGGLSAQPQPATA